MRIQNFNNLKEHLKKHMKIKLYQCSKCRKSFSSELIIHNHILSHIKNRPYTCFDKTCLSSFINIAQLKFHYKSKHFSCQENNLSEEERERKYNEVFQKKFNENRLEMEEKNHQYIEEYKEFKKNNPIICLDVNECETSCKENMFLNRKRRGSSYDLNQNFNDTIESFSIEEKVILVLLNFVKDKIKTDDFEKLIMCLDSIK